MEQSILDAASLATERLALALAIKPESQDGCDFLEGYNKGYSHGAEWQKEQYKELLTLLKVIAEWPGNLSNEVLQKATGPKDAALRGGIICDMRDIAIEAIRRHEPNYTPFK